MPVLTSWGRIVIRGTGVGAEVWQTGISAVFGAALTTQAAVQAMCDAIEPGVNTFWTAVKPSVFNTYAYTGIDLYVYDGGSTTALFHAATARTPVVGTKVSDGAPIDTALVVSMRTQLPGRSGRGRMYVPCHAPINTGGHISTTAPADVAAAFKVMLNTHGALTNGPVYAVCSRTLLQYNVLNKVICDDKPDVQRRRENKLAPSLVTSLNVP